MISRFDVICDLIQNICPTNSIGVEIGVYRGQSSQIILNKCTNVSTLYSVDPYVSFSHTVWPDALNNSQKEMDKRYHKTKRKLEKFGSRSVFLRMTSEEASYVVKNSLNFVFIDGNHSYEYVLKDLSFWFPKIKNKGLIFGHDWVDKGQYRSFFKSVKKAIRHYFSDKLSNIETGVFKPYNLKINYRKDYKGIVNQTMPEEIEDGIWWLIKNDNLTT